MMNVLHTVNIRTMIVFCTVLVLGSVALFSPETLAQPYPTKPIRMVVASTPGSSSDTVARLIGARLSEALGQQIIIDNRAGAGGRLGTEIAARAVQDGYTLFLISSSIIVNSAIHKDLRYDIIKDFSPISLLGTTLEILVVNPSVPATSIKELVTLAKSRPGVLKYGSGGSGSATHLSAEIFKFMTGTDILHIAYKGGTPPLTNTVSGEVDMSIQSMIVCVSLIKSGKLRALGVTSLKRTPLMPDLPTIAETVPGYEFMLWQGLVAPAKTPPAILSKLNTEVVKALNTSAVREQMAVLGNEPLGLSQKDFALYISEQLEKMKEAVKVSGARSEN